MRASSTQHESVPDQQPTPLSALRSTHLSPADRREQAEEFFSRRQVETVRVEWCDLHGASRGKHLQRDHFLAAVESGTSFSSAALQMDLRGEAHPLQPPYDSPAWASLVAMPDVACLYPSLLEGFGARCIADLFTLDGEPLRLSPRTALRQVIDQGLEMGFKASIGLELEFYLLPAGPGGHPAGRQVYRMHNSAEEYQFLDPIRRQMDAAGIALEGFCAEDGPGQFEFILERGPALEAADAAFLTRCLVKEQAARQGLIATFLSRPFADCSGSGCHIHQSLWTTDGEPAFLPDEDPKHSIFWHYLAGQLRYFEEASAFYLPTVNAYKRIALRQPEPIRIDWAYEDRSAALRVLGGAAGKLRVENRAVGGEANPYLTIGASLASGLEGIRNTETLPPFSHRAHPRDDASPGLPLPRSLGESLASLSQSETLKRWLGHDLVDGFVALKTVEARRFEQAITDWELAEYLPAL